MRPLIGLDIDLDPTRIQNWSKVQIQDYLVGMEWREIWHSKLFGLVAGRKAGRQGHTILAGHERE